jgi:hypothetical protein
MKEDSILKVAAIQTNSNYWDKEGNLEKVRPLLEEAAAKGAQLVLLPEMVAGYAYSFDIIWGSAELIPNGITSQFICSEAKRLQIHLGTTILEAKGEHFYNTFILAGESNAPSLLWASNLVDSQTRELINYSWSPFPHHRSLRPYSRHGFKAGACGPRVPLLRWPPWAARHRLRPLTGRASRRWNLLREPGNCLSLSRTDSQSSMRL